MTLKRRRCFLKKTILHIMTWKILEKINGLSNTARKKPVNYFLSLFFTRNEIPMCLSRLLLLKTMMICSILRAGRSACIITLGNSDPFVSVIISHFFHSVQSVYSVSHNLIYQRPICEILATINQLLVVVEKLSFFESAILN